MNWIWFLLIVISAVVAVFTGNMGELVNSILSSSQKAIEVMFYLVGIMCFWLGMMKIAEKSGFIKFLSNLFKPVARIIFDEIPPENDKIIGDITMNFTANALGIANAATPTGIKAMEEMNKINIDKTSASNSMCTFLGMNTAGFQLIPTTVLAILIANGSKNPTEIIVPTFIVTSVAFVSAIIISKLLAKVFPPQKVAAGEQEVEKGGEK